MAFRVTRTEGRVAVGPWTADLTKGEVLQLKKKGDPNRGFVPQVVADHLVAHGLLVEVPDDAEANPWFDSEEADRNGGVETDQVHGPVGNIHRMGPKP